ncbi:MAG TPA: hypothetical protein VKR31_08645, partial [Rhizomicrobium sp.]|nr:hypothetical protein [Rhizomicrobium sp.]
MSHDKALRVHGSLTLGVAALALFVGAGSAVAAGHEGRAAGAGLAAARGGGGAGDVRSVNERFGSTRVETLSPAGFVSPMSGTARETPSSTPTAAQRAPSADVVAPSSAARGPVRDPVLPSADTRNPTPDMKGPVRDPVLPSAD